MLFDLLHAVFTPAAFDHRRLGCVGDTIRMASRSRRCRAAWSPHLDATRAVIREAIASCAGSDVAVVLGSGLLDDVPLDDLARRFRRVVLIDAVHPWRARLAARRHGNVALITADLSGSFDLLLGRTNNLTPGLPAICSAPCTNLVVSVNLLSQLPLRPVARLENSAGTIGTWARDDGDRLGARIVADHLAALADLKARVCLITDLDEIEEDRTGLVHERHDLLYGKRLGEPDRCWAWELAPFGEIGRNRRLVHRVVAFAEWSPLREQLTRPRTESF